MGGWVKSSGESEEPSVKEKARNWKKGAEGEYGKQKKVGGIEKVGLRVEKGRASKLKKVAAG